MLAILFYDFISDTCDTSPDFFHIKGDSLYIDLPCAAYRIPHATCRMPHSAYRIPIFMTWGETS